MRRITVVAALVLVLFGCTFGWLIRLFLGLDEFGMGGPRSAIQLLVVLTAPLFAAAGWAVYQSLPRWRMPAITGSVLGTAISLRRWDAVSFHSKVTDPAANIAVRPAGSRATLAPLLLPGINRVVDHALVFRAPMNVGWR